MSRLHDLPLLERVTNFRELGGIETPDGRRVARKRLFRSSHWGSASDTDLEALASYGVGLVIDFRSENDIAQEGADRLPSGTRHVHLATSDPARATDIRTLIQQGDVDTIRETFGGDGAYRYMRQGAERMVTERAEVFAGFLSTLAEPGAPPALFHCSAGKDRAGWAASSLLLALGVDEAAVAEHYLLSNQYYQPSRQGGESWDSPLPEEVRALLRPLVEVKPEYVEASIATAKREWGSLDAYFADGLGLSDGQRQQLRDNWLE